MKIVVTGLSLALLLALGASSQERPARVADAVETSVHGYGDRDRTCQQWTDGCRSCTRQEAGGEACSNIGPTCQPAAISCVRRTEPAK